MEKLMSNPGICSIRFMALALHKHGHLKAVDVENLWISTLDDDFSVHEGADAVLDAACDFILQSLGERHDSDTDGEA